ncbi:MAG: DUF2460 domain-containing protein [Alphaproteobacteria bacterium]|nr:DUF2460 domain-containing protein [Alphaproteobacteria bacterium]
MTRINDVVAPSRITKAEVEWKTEVKDWPNGRRSAKRLWSSPRHTFDVEWDGISLAEYTLLKAHFNANFGRYGVFELLDTHDSTVYSVSYEDDSLGRENVRPNTAGLYRLRVTLVEEKT